jgi:hypothetical protein
MTVLMGSKDPLCQTLQPEEIRWERPVFLKAFFYYDNCYRCASPIDYPIGVSLIGGHLIGASLIGVLLTETIP